MMDTDNLKHMNDTFGHDWGDKYIRRAGQCLAWNTPPGTLCARISGDEFNVLFYGYDSQEAIREEIRNLKTAVKETSLTHSEWQRAAPEHFRRYRLVSGEQPGIPDYEKIRGLRDVSGETDPERRAGRV